MAAIQGLASLSVTCCYMEQAGQAPGGRAGLTTLRDQGEAVGDLVAHWASPVSWAGGNSRRARRLVGGTIGCWLLTPGSTLTLVQVLTLR